MGVKPVYRHEDKFLINYVQYVKVKQAVSAVMKRDIHAADGKGYTIRSLYFDTPFNRDYHEKEDGTDVRRKLRLRAYGSASGPFKLEIKHRREGGIFKESVTLKREDAEKLIIRGADPAFLLDLPSPAAANIYRLFKTAGYLPAAIIDYEREAFTLPFFETRVTFDRSIRTSGETERFFEPELGLIPVFPPDEIVLEVKYNHMFPSFLKPLTGIAEGQEMSISKYYYARLLLGR